MSSFFTVPASQRKRKRSEGADKRRGARSTTTNNRDDDDSISGSDISDDDQNNADAFSSGSEEDEFLNEDPAAKRVRLAEQYLANTQREVLEDGGFDAADVDQENLRRRTGERLKEDTAEDRGKLYKFIAEDHDWHAATCAQFRMHQAPVTGVAVAAGFVYTVGKDRALIKWALAEKNQVSRKPRKVKCSKGHSVSKKHHSAAILCVAASEDGRFVATGGADRRLIIWSADTLEPLRVFTGQQKDNGHRDAVLALAFRRGTNQLFSAGKDRTVKIWSCNELTYVETLFGHQDEVLDIDALGKEICVSAGARDRTARYWRVVEEVQLVFRGGGAAGRGNKRNDELVKYEEVSDAHEGSIDRIALVDDDTFVTGSDNGALTLWNITKKKPIFSLPSAHGTQPPPSLEDRTAEADQSLQYQDMEELLDLKAQPRWITALDVVPFSDLIISGSWDGFLRIFKITPDRRRIEAVGILGTDDKQLPGFVNDIAVLERGERGKDGLIIAAAVGREHRLARWQVASGKNAGYIFEVSRKTRANGH